MKGTGLRNWVWQRVTGVFLGAYFVAFVVYFMKNPNLSYNDWSHLFQNPLVQVSTFIVLLSLGVHAWVGVATIATDYIKISFLRLLFLIAVAVALLSYFAWGIRILLNL